MCEAIWCIKDGAYSNPDHSIRRGDLIAVCPDGWQWGEKELTEPRFGITSHPGESAERLMSLTEPVMNEDGLVLKRGKYLNLDAPDMVNIFTRDSRIDVLLANVITRDVPGRVVLG